MSELTDSLTRKLGPLPVWAWGVGLGVAVNVGRYALDKRKPKDDDENADPSTAETAAGYSEATAGGGFLSGVPSPSPNPGGWGGPAADPVVGSGTAAEDTETSPQSNAAWLADAVGRIVRTDGVGFAAVDTALQKYLQGRPLTPIEQSFVAKAFSYSGYPPEGAPPIVSAGTQQAGDVAQQPSGPAPAPAPSPAPAPQPSPAVRQSRTLVNFGPEGSDGWTAFLYENGVLRWITDGNEYARLRDSGMARIDLLDRNHQLSYLRSVRTAGAMPYTLTGDLATAWQGGQ